MDLRDRIVKALSDLAVYTIIDDGPNYKFKAEAFEKAATAVENFEGDIRSITTQTPGVGESSLAVIQDVISNGISSRLYQLEQKYPGQKQAIDYFTRYHGIGPTTALLYYEKGLSTIQQVWNAGLLTPAQKEGVIWFNHIQLPISQREMDDIKSQLTESLLGTRWEMTGSYRRGKGVYSDVDILVAGRSMDDILSRLGDRIVATLSKGDTMFSGMYRASPYENAHRIDIRVVSPDQFPAALLYFTGSKAYNRGLRLYANNLGYKLTNNALLYNGRPVPVNSEADIFTALKMGYVPPESRN